MRYWQLVTGLLVLWLFIIIYMSNSVFPNASDASLRTERQLQRAMEELQKLRNQNKELHSLASELKNIKLNAGVMEYHGDVDTIQKRLDKVTNELKQLSKKSASKNSLSFEMAIGGGSLKSDMSSEPSLQHEISRRKLERDTTEFWFYIRSELNKIKEQTAESTIVKKINAILADSTEYQKMLKSDLYTLRNTVDNNEKWRFWESQKLGDLVQRRFEYLQNPKDCSKAKKMVCNLGKGCGYGCQLHHVTYCLMMAYATQRTLILESKGWRYSMGGWETVFLPLSNTCNDKSGQASSKWGAQNAIKDVQVVEMPIVDSLHPRPKSLPLAIPEDLADRMIRFHGDPAVWWIGQFVSYLTRPQKHLSDDLKESKRRLGFSNPIVGVHVRRTDKVGLEAAFHDVVEYMTYVDEWFDAYEKRHPGVIRKVFLASDEPSVLVDAKKKYPNYIFISDNEVSKSAGLGSRYTDASLRGVILDIHLLSLCDFLVCTFSSQVCRVAYELMQPMHGDAAHWFKSLDDMYYFGGQNGHEMRAIQAHEAGPNIGGIEIDLQPDDLVGIAGNHWNGYSKGKNMRTGKTGLFPSYKVVDEVVRVKMPTYPEVKEL